MRYLKILFFAAALLSASCIKNTVPYPVVKLNITGIEAEGMTSYNIDPVQRVVTLRLDEKTDIQNVHITGVRLTEGATASPEPVGVFDMRTPISVTLSLYQDYQWSIRAEQNIERLFRLEGQVGATEFDLQNLTAKVYLPEGSDLSDINVIALKLGPADITTYSPTMEELSELGFEEPRSVNVTCHNRTERWTLSVEMTDTHVSIIQADAWSKVIWLYGAGIEGESLGFRYRVDGTGEWFEVPDVEVDGGSFKARLVVEPETTYQVKAYSNDNESAVRTLTTEAVMQLPNAGMEIWSKPKNPWLPYLSDASGNPIDQFWDTGNHGSTTLGSSYNVTTPVEDIRPGSDGIYSAQLASRFVGILTLGKFAAGNLVVGKYAATKGTNGVFNFGRPYTLRPTALRLWVKYNCGVIDNKNDIGSQPIGMNFQVGDSDIGSIFIALGTWTKEKYGYGLGNELFGTDDSPVSVDTREPASFFNPKGEDVIAYGERMLLESVDEWTQITIPIEYRSTNEHPTHIILVCSASRYGDYFTGSRNSKMWLDDIELIYE